MNGPFLLAEPPLPDWPGDSFLGFRKPEAPAKLQELPLLSAMTSSAIRRSFLEFFRERQHTQVPSSSLLPDAPNLLFTNAGMNPFVPIFLGRAPCPYTPARVVDTQKCIRAGGKHNDLEDVGFDTYHHTFFEMLGNWSFGDYFKKEAIAWAWDLVVQQWNFPASRLYATVYRPGPGDPAQFDQEAYDLWAAIFTRAGLDPAVHIVDGHKKDNFWMMGETGPCGPCSELHVDLTPGPRALELDRQLAARTRVNAGDPSCIEIWNLVFIQFNANPDGTFVDLPARHVDTGMGFERVCSIIQGTKNLTTFSADVKISNYETDIFRPLFSELEKLTDRTYGSTLPATGAGATASLTAQEKTDVAFRVIADHVRTLSFALGDGIRPGNEGRGYVLRRILRRAVRYGRDLGLREPFLARLVPVLGKTMGELFPEMVSQAATIKSVLTQEEESFFRTLERGLELFEQAIEAHHPSAAAVTLNSGAQTATPSQPADALTPNLRSIGQSLEDQTWDAHHAVARETPVSPAGIFSGATAFKLFDTYGFPLDLTELMARERGLAVDTAEFDRLMDEQKARARAAQVKEVVTLEPAAATGLRPTVFYGFDELQSVSLILARPERALVTAETPFYAEMGGQVGDTGEVEISGRTIPITGTVRSAGVTVHQLGQPVQSENGQPVTLRVDPVRRGKIEAHHSGTHLLHWALRQMLGPTVAQKGSYVGPDRLRFDFSHGTALTPEQIAELDATINHQVEADLQVTWGERPYAEVKNDPSILQFFGDKYGPTVRVVSIGEISRELCGGTHVRRSGRVGFFKILSEGAIAAGVRRIEAASGSALIEHVREQLLKQEETHSILRQRNLDLTGLRKIGGEASPMEIWRLWETRESELRRASAELAQQEKLAAKQQEIAWQQRAALAIPGLIATARTVAGTPFLTAEFADTPAVYLPILAEALRNRWQGVAVFAASEGEKVALLATVSPSYVKQFPAGKLIQASVPHIGGKGGGRPDLAQGGGTRAEGIGAAFAAAEAVLR